MMMKVKTILILVVLCVFYYGCGDNVSEKDAQKAIFTVMRGCESTEKDNDPEISNKYQNAADFTYSVEDGAVVNEMTLVVNDDKSMDLTGTCQFSDYTDPYSGYTVEGKLTYSCERSSDLETYCDIECEAVLMGGKVETLAFSMEMDPSGEMDVASIIANGEKVELNKWDKILKIVRAFEPRKK